MPHHSAPGVFLLSGELGLRNQPQVRVRVTKPSARDRVAYGLGFGTFDARSGVESGTDIAK